MKKLLLVSALVMALVGCKKDTEGCDSTKYNCEPVSSVASEVVVSEPLIAASEPVETAEAYQADALPKAPSSKEILTMINIEKETLIKNEMNMVMGTNYNGWNVMVNSVKPDPRDPNNMWIVNYDVSTGEKGILSDECDATVSLSEEDNMTLMLTTLDTDCYSFLKDYV